jgi:cyclomaltodextrinase
MPVPYWIQDAIFYQIFPDRFANGDQRNDPSNVQPWGSSPTAWGFMGGDLRGVIQQFDYLLDLGVNALYLNPIFQSSSTHRYNTTDYYKIDPKLGDLPDFNALIELAHAHRMRVILDGVFNHCGRGFFAFNDILENQENSPYRDWFHVLRFPVTAYGPGDAQDYRAWWGYKSLPKFNTTNPAVRRYLLEVARYWIEAGADGWRLDVPNEIDDDSFWAEFRSVVKTANPDAYIVGEIWTPELRWVGENHFDGLINYPLRDVVLEFLNGSFLMATEYAQKVEDLVTRYPRENAYAMYLCLGSHDTERLLTALGGNLDKIKLALAIEFAHPGAPGVYYGDEVGLQGGKDPGCRGAFPWNQALWNAELRAWVKTLIALRKRHTALRRGDYQRVYVDDRTRIYACARTLGSESILIAINASPVRRQVSLPVSRLGWADGHIVRDLLGQDEYIVSGDNLILSLRDWGAAWLC